MSSIVKTKAVYKSEGLEILSSDTIEIDFADVSAIMLGNKEGSQTIVFLNGRDLLIEMKYKEASKHWHAARRKRRLDERTDNVLQSDGEFQQEKR